MEELRTCGLCHARHPAEELHPFDSLELCETCFHERTVLCSSCGVYRFSSHFIGCHLPARTGRSP